MKEKRRERVVILLTDEEKHEIKRHCKKIGEDVSTVLRRLALDLVDKGHDDNELNSKIREIVAEVMRESREKAS